MYLFLNYSAYTGTKKENFLETLWILTCLLLNPRPQTIHMCLGTSMENKLWRVGEGSGHLFSPSLEEASHLSQTEAGWPSGKFPVINLVPKSSNGLIVRNGLGVRKRERDCVYCQNRLPLSCPFSPQKGGTVADSTWCPGLTAVWSFLCPVPLLCVLGSVLLCCP